MPVRLPRPWPSPPPPRLAAAGEEAYWLLSSSVRPSEEVVELGRLFLGVAPSAEVGRRFDMLLASKSLAASQSYSRAASILVLGVWRSRDGSVGSSVGTLLPRYGRGSVGSVGTFLPRYGRGRLPNTGWRTSLTQRHSKVPLSPRLARSTGLALCGPANFWVVYS